MKLRFPRRKPRHLLLSLLYRLHKLPWAGDRAKLRLYLDLEWIFSNLINELSFRLYRPIEHPFRLEAISFLSGVLDKSHAVLDLGCKAGDMSALLADRVKKVVGIDHDAEAIDEARRTHRAENLLFVHDDARDFLARDRETYDVLILSHILEHIEEPEAMIRQFRDRFRFIYIELPDLDSSPLPRYRRDAKTALQYADDDHIWEFGRAEALELAASCGLEVLRSEFKYGVQRHWCRVVR
jgi:SAM-dependent methyltransferase